MVTGTWSDECGYFKSLDSYERWRGRLHGALPIYNEAPGIRQTDQSCHHEICLQMDLVERRTGQVHHERHERGLHMEECSAPYHHSEQKHQTGEDASDFSHSSWIKATISHKTGVIYHVDVSTMPTSIEVHMSVQAHQLLT